MNKLTESEYELLYTNAKITLDRAIADQAKWVVYKEKLIQTYIKKLNKVNKNVIRSNKNLIAQQKRMNALNELVNGTPVNLLPPKKKVMKVEEKIEDTAMIDPTTGELIMLSGDEIKNLLNS
jgi:hypothetical protein